MPLCCAASLGRAHCGRGGVGALAGACSFIAISEFLQVNAERQCKLSQFLHYRPMLWDVCIVLVLAVEMAQLLKADTQLR